MSADLKAQVAHAWPAFFAVHGSFTEVQERAMPCILAGWDVLLVAPTATGKTEAAIAPLVERHLIADPRGTGDGLSVLYLCPTRALVRDMFERLRRPFAQLGITSSMKSGDTGPVSTSRPPDVLITTPESFDSLLTRAPRLLAGVRALVMDEIHLFDDGPRGDQLRCLLRRLERVRDYDNEARGDATPPLQRIALSATVADPRAVGERYLNDPVIIDIRGGRTVQAELYPLETLHDLSTALAERGAIKTLVFCNTRNEVEQVASHLRHDLAYDAAVFVHYSNLDPALRRDVESRFAEASVAVCVSSSTLELGIDIGTIDEVALLGPPSTPGSFLQRIGRGGRRGKVTRVLCLARSYREHLRFLALLTMAHADTTSAGMGLGAAGAGDDSAMGGPGRTHAYHFRPSVLVQQVFSLLKQSPTGGLRFADLRRIAPYGVSDDTLRRILDHLTATCYLRSWRPFEWRAGERLAELADAHEIYGNIGGHGLGATIVDAYSGRRIARTDRPRTKGETLLMGGRPVEVAWRDRFTFGVNEGKRSSEEALRFRTAPQAVSLELAQGVAAQVRRRPGELHLLADGPRLWLFHFWGDIYGRLLAASLTADFAELADDGTEAPPGVGIRRRVHAWNELCVQLPRPLDVLPPWDASLAEAEARRMLARLEPYLDMGRFQSLLPSDVATRSALEQIDLPRLEGLYRAASIVTSPAAIRDELRALL